MARYDYNPLIFNEEQNSAFNAANSIHHGLTNIAQFIVMPYVMHKGVQWYFGPQGPGGKPKQPAVVAVRQRPQNMGWLGSLRYGAGRAMNKLWHKVKPAFTYFIGPEVLSHTAYDYLGLARVSQSIQPLTTALMRPFLEKIMPALYSPWDKGDIDISFRMFITDKSNTWYNYLLGWTTPVVGKPLVWIRNTAKYIFGNPTFAEKNAADAFEFAEWVADGVESAVITTRDVLWSTSQIVPTIMSGPKKTLEAVGQAVDYFQGSISGIAKATAPVREAAADWAVGFSHGVYHLSDAWMSMVADNLESYTKGWVPAKVAYYAQVATGGAGMSYLGYRAAKLGYQKLDRYFSLPAIMPGVHATFNNVQHGGGGAQANPGDPQQQQVADPQHPAQGAAPGNNP